MAWVVIANLKGVPGDGATLEILNATPRRRGSADGLNLNNLFVPTTHFGTWSLSNVGGTSNLPGGFTFRGVLEVVGDTQYNVVQRVTDRDANVTWQRTGTNTGAVPPVWTAWKVIPGNKGSAAGFDLNTLFLDRHLGTWSLSDGAGIGHLPTGFTFRGVLEIVADTQFNVVQRVTDRDQNVTWQRTGTDTAAPTPVWTPWKVAAGPRGSADGFDLDILFLDRHFGTWTFLANSGTRPIPSALLYRATLEIFGADQYTVVQRITDRLNGATWQRTCPDSVAATPVWTEWNLVNPPAKSDLVLCIIGDSLAGTLGIVEALQANTPEMTFGNRGWPGETSDGINMRIGAKRTLWKVSGGSIPASGSVTITTDMTLAFPELDMTYTGHLNGVNGTISRTGTSTFSFTRATAGSAVASPGKVLFDPRWAASNQFMAFGITMGRNDISLASVGMEGDVVDHVFGNYQELLEWQRANRKLYFILGTLNRWNEPRGHERYEQVVALNNRLRESDPSHYIPWREYIVHQVIYDLGITPTTEDLENMANDCPPPSVMADMTHPTQAAGEATADNLIRPWMIAKGWF